uniref:Uncharacterized protein n=1 Tax=Arundo donax TaxID=35708 RepID=A0A0A9GMZ4_ARUDO
MSLILLDPNQYIEYPDYNKRNYKLDINKYFIIIQL